MNLMCQNLDSILTFQSSDKSTDWFTTSSLQNLDDIIYSHPRVTDSKKYITRTSFLGRRSNLRERSTSYKDVSVECIFRPIPVTEVQPYLCGSYRLVFYHPLPFQLQFKLLNVLQLKVPFVEYSDYLWWCLHVLQ